MGEDLTLLTGANLRSALAAYEAELMLTVPARLHDAFEAEQQALATEANTWLHRYNQSIHQRIQGYLALGSKSHWEFPWPTVAVLGLSQVLGGVLRTRLCGLAGRLARGLGGGMLERLASGIDDVLLRTNRSIFADSIPVVLMGLRCHQLRREGRAELAKALLEGPTPLLMDEDCRALAWGLYQAMGIPSAEERFVALAELTHGQFHREQAIFSHHIGNALSGKAAPALKLLLRFSEISAPHVEHGPGGRRLVLKSFPLPSNFQLDDHETRVELFGQAFVHSITGSIADYETAVGYVLEQFSEAPEPAPLSLFGGGKAAPQNPDEFPQHAA